MATIFFSDYITARGELVKQDGEFATVRVNGRLMHGRLALLKNTALHVASSN
jgi:hypothetical protein